MADHAASYAPADYLHVHLRRSGIRLEIPANRVIGVFVGTQSMVVAVEHTVLQNTYGADTVLEASTRDLPERWLLHVRESMREIVSGLHFQYTRVDLPWYDK